MLMLIPWLVASVGGLLGWKVGRLVGPWTGAVLAILGLALGFYYGVKLRRAATP